jgi:hypothetical protein
MGLVLLQRVIFENVNPIAGNHVRLSGAGQGETYELCCLVLMPSLYPPS